MSDVNRRFAVMTAEKVLQMLTFLKCVVTELYFLIKCLSLISPVLSGFYNIHYHDSCVAEYSVTIHPDSRESLLFMLLVQKPKTATC